MTWQPSMLCEQTDFDAIWRDAANADGSTDEVETLIAGVHCTFRSQCEWTTFFIRELLSHHTCREVPQCDRRHEIVIALVDGLDPLPPMPAARCWEGQVADGTHVTVVHSAEHLSEMRIGADVSLLTDLSSGRTVVRVAESRHGQASRRPQPGGYVIPFLQFLLSAHRLYVIHGAAVAYQGRSLLLLGDSGVGKSTTAVALSRGGMGFMGDDLVAVEDRGGTMLSHALLLKVGLEERPGEGKEIVDSVSRDNLQVCPVSRIAGVAYLERRGAPAHSLVRAPRAQVLAWVLRQANDVRFVRHGEHWINAASALADTVSGWTWSLGPPDTVDPTCVEEIFA